MDYQEEKKCMNFDFGAHWEEIRHFLSRKVVDDLCQLVVADMDSPDIIFRPDRPPSCWLSWGDAYVTFLDNLTDPILQRRDKRYLTKEEIAFLREYSKHKFNDDDRRASVQRYCKLREKVQDRLGYDYTKCNDKLAFYVPFGRCHWWNPIFGLWLAKKVCPLDRWVVRRGKNHTTVYCAEKHMVFDILYWALDGRLENHVSGLRYRCKDISLGGIMAFDESV